MTGTMHHTEWTGSSESVDIPSAPYNVRPPPNPARSTRTASIFRQPTMNLRFSGTDGHPVNARHFLKEFRITMRDLALDADHERIRAFEDYLVVDSPAEAWYLEVLPRYLGGSWEVFQAGFLSRFPGKNFKEGAQELKKIKSVKFRQDAAVSAYIKITWIEATSEARRLSADWTDVASKDEGTVTKGGETSPTESTPPACSVSMKLGSYKPIATEEIFNLKDYGVPDGAVVNFSSHVWAVRGDYTSDEWFIHDASSSKGADFRQSGTAFKGWFNHTGKYDL